MTGAASPFGLSVLKGLQASPKRLEPKFFYDDIGSRLFEQITELEAYYPTRTELSILEAHAAAIAAGMGKGAVLVEPGAGALLKAGILLRAMDRPAAFAPGDISADHLAAAAAGMAADFPGLAIRPFAVDFDRPFTLPAGVAELGPVAVFFPGSTIGNFEPDRARDLLGRFRAIASADSLTIGVDLKKDVARLERAYDDLEGVTAAFNLNILARANRELDADFDLAGFRHVALWNAADGRIEMHLESLAAQTVTIRGRAIAFQAGERIHTENSYKYTIDDFQALAAAAGWRSGDVWTDPDRLFAVLQFRAP